MIDQIFYIQQILERKWEDNGTAPQLLIDFKKSYDSFRREVLHNILIEFGIPKKLVALFKMCLKEDDCLLALSWYMFTDVLEARTASIIRVMSLLGTTTQKRAVFIFTSVRTSNYTCLNES
jgi:hypothetical protein